MKFFIDESLSPQLAIRLNQTGHHEAVHPLHAGRGWVSRTIGSWSGASPRIELSSHTMHAISVA